MKLLSVSEIGFIADAAAEFQRVQQRADDFEKSLVTSPKNDGIPAYFESGTTGAVFQFLGRTITLQKRVVRSQDKFIAELTFIAAAPYTPVYRIYLPEDNVIWEKLGGEDWLITDEMDVVKVLRGQLCVHILNSSLWDPAE